MPFAEVIEPGVVVMGCVEEGFKRREDALHKPDETREGAALALNRELLHSKRIWPDMLPHEHTANLAAPCLNESGSHLIDNLRREQELHAFAFQAARRETVHCRSQLFPHRVASARLPGKSRCLSGWSRKAPRIPTLRQVQ